MKKEKGNKRGHLAKEERIKIRTLLDENYSYQRIANNLKRGKSTIQAEVTRNGGKKKYDPTKAQLKAYLRQYRKKRHCNKVAMSKFLTRFIEKSLALGWSPERISSRLGYLVKKGKIKEYASPKSIRKYVKKRPGLLERFFFWRRVNKKSGPKKGSWIKDDTRKFIDKMPKITRFGSFEVDFIVSSKSKSVLLVLVDVVTKITLMRVLPNRVNLDVNDAIVEMLEPYKGQVDRLIPDNDIAFGLHRELAERIGADIYFAKPYCSTDKPLVENTNRWIRVFIPKKKDLAKVSDDFVLNIQNWFNNTPRECLEGMTPMEKFEKEMGHDTINENYPRHPLISPLSNVLSTVRIWG